MERKLVLFGEWCFYHFLNYTVNSLFFIIIITSESANHIFTCITKACDSHYKRNKRKIVKSWNT